MPERAWFLRRFRASRDTVSGAFATLVREGFARTAPRGGSFVADRLPFEGRYLLLLYAPLEAPEGLDAALVEAARRQEGRRGVCWDVRRNVPPSDPAYAPLADAVVRQRYAGVFVRNAVPLSAPGPAGRAIETIPRRNELMPCAQRCLDNVVAKGFRVRDVFLADEDCRLSDHRIIGCTLETE